MFSHRCIASNPVRRSALAALGAVSLALFAPAAQANITFTFGSGTVGGGPDNNVLFNNGPQTSTSIMGTTNGGGVDITFTSSQSLSAQGGQAKIEATSGNITQDITIGVEDTFGLRFIEFQPTPVSGQPEDFFSILATDQFGNTFQSDLFEGGPGKRILSIRADDQLITSLVFQVGAGSQFTNLDQFRVDARSINNPGSDPVPEPSEWLAMGMATASVGGLMVRARRRRRIAA